MHELNVIINGVARTVAATDSIRTILESAGIASEGTAVAVNDRVVPRSTHADVRLAAGDRIEIVHAVAGG